MPSSEDYLEVRKKLDAISPSACLAKWMQVTLLLQNGNTHSCHHPMTHRVPEEEVAKNPDAIHNSLFKMRRRKEMLEGKRPKECEYCWKIEDISPELVSDRIVKSGENWALPQLDKIREHPWNWRVTPSYVEVSFSNTCNFACAYCGPQSSSKWAEEMRKLGPFPVLPRDRHHSLEFREEIGEKPIPESEYNPYVDAFWKWWPELYPSLKVLRITGGEPLMTRNTFRVLDYVDAHPRPDMELAINSNLGAPKKLIDEFADKAEILTEGGKVKSLVIYTSIDSWGKQAEYIRYGMDFEEYWKTVRGLLKRLRNVQLVFMCTTHAMSIPGLGKLLEGVAGLKREFGVKPATGQPRVMIDLPYLRTPPFLSAKILPHSFDAGMEDCLRYVEATMGRDGFHELERVRMQRLLAWFKAPEEGRWLYVNRLNFGRFIGTYDERRKLNFAKCFPELADFLHECRSLNFERVE